LNLSLPTPESIIAFSICLGIACTIFGALLGQKYEAQKINGTVDLNEALRFAYEESDHLRQVIRERNRKESIASLPLFDYEDHK
jgi:hypothetical protein